MRRIDSFLIIHQMKLSQSLIVIIFCLIMIFSGTPKVKGSPEADESSGYKTSDNLKILKMEKGLLGFKIGSTKISEIQNKLGKAEMQKGGKHEPDSFCYVSNKDQDNTVLEFETNILGYKDFFQGFVLYSVKPYHLFNKNCMPSDMVHKNITTLGSIRLDQDREFLKSILGNPTHEDGNIIKYKIKYRVPWPDDWYTDNNRPEDPKEKYYYEILVDIYGQFIKGNLTVLKISEHAFM